MYPRRDGNVRLYPSFTPYHPYPSFYISQAEKFAVFLYSTVFHTRKPKQALLRSLNHIFFQVLFISVAEIDQFVIPNLISGATPEAIANWNDLLDSAVTITDYQKMINLLIVV